MTQHCSKLVSHRREKMGKLAPEWILSLPEEAIDGLIANGHLVVLGQGWAWNSKVFYCHNYGKAPKGHIFIFDLETRLLHTKFRISMDSDDRTLSINKYEDTFIVLCKSGRLSIYSEHGKQLNVSSLISQPGFCGSKERAFYSLWNSSINDCKLCWQTKFLKIFSSKVKAFISSWKQALLNHCR